MITFKNYNSTIDRIGVQNLPQVLQEAHKWYLNAKDFYKKDKEVKETIDLYFNKLSKVADKEITSSLNGTDEDAEILKCFLDFHNMPVKREEVLQLIHRIHQGIADKVITKSSSYADEIRDIQERLVNIFNNTSSPKIKIVLSEKDVKRFQPQVRRNSSKKKELTLAGLPESIEIKPTLPSIVKTKPTTKPKLPNGFVNIDELDTIPMGDGFHLRGAIGELLGNLERYRLAITIEGDQGGGKTRFTYQLADAFADKGYKIGIFSLEIGGKSDLIKRMKNDYIMPGNRNKVSITGEAPDGIKSIRQAAETFDVVIIDSWNKLNVDSSVFDKLRNDYPDTIWIVIFQRTASGTIRGGTAPLYDAGINIEVVKSPDGFKYNYAHCSKNRYGETGIRYSIAEKKIIAEE
jgi:hypothetical protein